MPRFSVLKQKKFGKPKIFIKSCHISHVMRKSAFCICQIIGADQLCGNRAADLRSERLCFRYMIETTIPLFPKSKITNLKPSYMIVQPGMYRTWSEIATGFLTAWLLLAHLSRRLTR